MEICEEFYNDIQLELAACMYEEGQLKEDARKWHSTSHLKMVTP